MVPKCEGLGVDTLFPLAVLATSRGRGAGGRALPAAAGPAALTISFHTLDPESSKLPLSPFVLAADAVGVPAFARKFFVTDTALNVAGFLTELDRAWCLVSDSSLLVISECGGPPVSVSELTLPSTAICSAGVSAVSCSGTWSIDDIRSEIGVGRVFWKEGWMSTENMVIARLVMMCE